MTAGHSLRISGLRKSYAVVPALRGIDLVVGPKEFVTLLGPSGCGKTTLLRCVAGLEIPDGGEITLGDRTLMSARRGVHMKPEKRRIGMVFQNYALWPHMSVEQNVAYPLRMRGVKRVQALERAAATLKLVELDGFEKRPVGKLSGGQQQRVALARAVVAAPDMTLFDEPLSNLDAGLRESLRDYIREAHELAGGLSLYVTHDQSEALALADRIAVMFDGVIRQVGTPAEVYNRPATRQVAEFLGFDNFLIGTAREGSGGRVSVKLDAADALLHGTAVSEVLPGARVLLAVRSNHLSIGSVDPSDTSIVDGVLDGHVIDLRDHQSVRHRTVAVGDLRLAAREMDAPALGNAFRGGSVGDRVRIGVHPDQAVVIPVDPDSGVEESGNSVSTKGEKGILR